MLCLLGEKPLSLVLPVKEVHRWQSITFNFRYRDRLSTDDLGIDLPNLAAAAEVAIRSAIELVEETIKCDGGAIPDAMIVTDEDGKTLATISILDVLRKRRREV
jgi:hypothetical protein